MVQQLSFLQSTSPTDSNMKYRKIDSKSDIDKQDKQDKQDNNNDDTNNNDNLTQDDKIDRAKYPYDHLVKLLMIGDTSVGKSSMLLQFVNNIFTDNFISTIGIDFRVRTINVDNSRLKLQIWDTSGQERFKSITRAYYRGAMGIILVYDVTNEESFDNIIKWINDIKTSITRDVTTDMVLVANKCDCKGNIKVSHAKGKELADLHGMKFFETSSKDINSINNLFYTIAKDIKNNIKNKPNYVDITEKNKNNHQTVKITPKQQEGTCSYCSII
jgi:Ras-related protein Rab-8A